MLNEALSLLTAGPSSDAAWVSFAQTHYPTLSADTLDKIREQLGVAPADFAIVKGVLDDQIVRSRQSGAFDLTPEQAEQLAQFDQKYGLVETLRKLQ